MAGVPTAPNLLKSLIWQWFFAMGVVSLEVAAAQASNFLEPLCCQILNRFSARGRPIAKAFDVSTVGIRVLMLVTLTATLAGKKYTQIAQRLAFCLTRGRRQWQGDS